MNIVLIMSDKDTGEILWQTSRQLACNFVKGDAGRALIALSTIRPIKARPASPLTKLQAS